MTTDESITKIRELIAKASQTGLDGLDVIQLFTLTEIAEIYNGIGPEAFPAWLRNLITSCNGLFEPAALIHDVDYHIGGDKKTFYEANQRFKSNCYKLTKQKYGWYNPMRYIIMNKANRWTNYCQFCGWKGYKHDNI